jgi:hypothetical protein
VLDVVAEMDLTAIYGEYRADGHGRAAFDPAMMVALLLYAVLHSRLSRVADSPGAHRRLRRSGFHRKRG